MGSDTEPQFRRTQMAAPSQRRPVGRTPQRRWIHRSGDVQHAGIAAQDGLVDVAPVDASPLANLLDKGIEAANQCPLHRR